MASDSTTETFGTNRGMPVLFMAEPDAPLSLTVTMRKSATNALVDTTTVTNGSLPADLTPNQVFAVPSIYLEPDTSYTVRAVGTVEGVLVDRTSHFTTGRQSHSAPFVAGLATGTLRLVYTYPTDRTASDEYRDAVQYALEHLQGWYQQQLVGRDSGVDECARQRPVHGMPRWIGITGHEVGHTLGLAHPCNTYQSGCDLGSIMWDGAETYPVAHIAPADRELLLAHRFINAQRFGR